MESFKPQYSPNVTHCVTYFYLSLKWLSRNTWTAKQMSPTVLILAGRTKETTMDDMTDIKQVAGETFTLFYIEGEFHFAVFCYPFTAVQA